MKTSRLMTALWKAPDSLIALGTAPELFLKHTGKTKYLRVHYECIMETQ
jgi:hypothetical protein